ncbi:MAG: hypothetical protein O3B84_04460 [Chloroflexi bacterium]|nr:hypothetical protein [Chloroflexota bacterium]
MAQRPFLATDERAQFESLIEAFTDHGCGLGLDIRAQAAMRRLLGSLDEAERALESSRGVIDEQRSTIDRLAGRT